MRQFYESYYFLEIGQTVSAQIETKKSTPDYCNSQKRSKGRSVTPEKEVQKRQTVSSFFDATNQLEQQTMSTQFSHTQKKEFFNSESFLNIFFHLGFSHHILLIHKCPDFQERFFYMERSAQHQWSYRVLQYHIESDLFHRQGKIQSNFETALPVEVKKHALEAFKDEYLFNFLQVTDEDCESVLEKEIVNNVKRFMMSLGNTFTFVGNQYRLVVGSQEYFIDLLFFHRELQCLIAIELKTGMFKPEYIGKMNFYLSALDTLVKLPHKLPSIGIVLCKEKDRTVVEFTFRDIEKPLGVGTYVLDSKVSARMKKYLPHPDEFRKLLDKKQRKK